VPLEWRDQLPVSHRIDRDPAALRMALSFCFSIVSTWLPIAAADVPARLQPTPG
jgi:hypothetical protein